MMRIVFSGTELGQNGPSHRRKHSRSRKDSGDFNWGRRKAPAALIDVGANVRSGRPVRDGMKRVLLTV